MRKKTSTNYLNEEKVLIDCPIYAATQLISARWRSHILWFLRKGPQRFGQIRKSVPIATERMIALRLRDLLNDGLIEKIEGNESFTYKLTKKGKQLIPILEALFKVKF